MKTVYRVYCWMVESDQFKGMVYNPKVVLDTMLTDTNVRVTRRFELRSDEPPPYMTYDINIIHDDDQG